MTQGLRDVKQLASRQDNIKVSPKRQQYHKKFTFFFNYIFLDLDLETQSFHIDAFLDSRGKSWVKKMFA